MKSKKSTLLRVYIFITVYCSILKPIFGRWATMISDIALLLIIAYYIITLSSIKIYKKHFILISFIIVIQVIGIISIFHPNINNKLYSLIEYRKSYFQMVAIIGTYLCVYKEKTNPVPWIDFIGTISAPAILYGIKQHFAWNNIDEFFLKNNDADYWTLRYNNQVRSLSFFSGPFHYGLFCVLMFAVYWFLFVSSKTKKNKIKYLIFAIMSVFGCYCSYTRTNIICAVVVFAIWYFEFFLYEHERFSGIKKAMLSIALIVVIVTFVSGMFFSILSDDMFYKLVFSITHISTDRRFIGRYTTWNRSREYILRSPLFGWGMGSAGDTLGVHNISEIYITTHNVFYKLWMEIGIIGLILYVAVIIIITMYNRKQSDYRLISLSYGLSASILLNGFVGSTISTFPCMTIYWVIMTILLMSKTECKGKRE